MTTNVSDHAASGATAAPPALEVRDLRFRYARRPASDWLIDVPKLVLAPGEHLLVTAGSGRGKSTFLHLAAGLLEPAHGSVLVAGDDLFARRGAARDRLRGRRIGMIFQTFNLIDGFSAIENVLLALMVSEIPAARHRERARALLAELSIDDPAGDPRRMSVGQQQRIAIARAVACEPAIVLADEPTASLDPENAARAMDLIQRTCREHGAALLCTSHDPAMVDRFERRTTLESLGARAPGAAA